MSETPPPDNDPAEPDPDPGRVRAPTLNIPVATTEALFAPATIRMFGRPFTGLTLGDFGLMPATHHNLARHLREAQANPSPETEAGLARIYGFSYQGGYYKMPCPPVMLVFGAGVEVPTGFDDDIRTAGFEFSAATFLGGVRMWTVDELDYGVRIDVNIGWIADILTADAEDGDDQDLDQPQMSGRAMLQSKASSKLASKLTSKLASKLTQR